MSSRRARAGVVAALITVGALVAPLAQSDPSTLREPQGRPELGRGTAGSGSARAQSRADMADPAALSRIREEGLQRSQVMDTLSWLTDVYGPRLTNSPQIRDAAKWAVGRLHEWRIEAVRMEPWGPFGRGWSNDRLSVAVIAPTPWDVIALPKAWTPGTGGPISADAVMALLDGDDDFEMWTGKLKGKIVLTSRPLAVKPQFDPPGRRLTDGDLAEMERQEALTGPAAYKSSSGEFARRQMRFLAREGVVAVLEPGPGVGDRGSVLAMGPDDAWRTDAPAGVPQLVVATEHYGRIARILERGVPVRLELDVRNRFYDQPLDSFNIVAELRGTDKAGEVVMLGAHFDSWHVGTGATDNAAGVAATMEALRILKTSGLTMRRTVRLALWTGEEEGLLGSRAYVRQQFANTETMALKPAHEKLSVYFNVDHGTGAIRGVYLEGNAAARPIFKTWMAPLADLGMKTTSLRGTGDTDHVSFDEAGLPGFQFIQDPIEYYTSSHHSSMDLYERAQADDLKKNAVLIASLVYQAANRDGLLPRKPLPKPRVSLQYIR